MLTAVYFRKLKQPTKSKLVFLDLSWGRQQDRSAGSGKAVGTSSVADLAQLKPVAKVYANLSEIPVKAQQPLGVRCVYPMNCRSLSFDKA